MKHICCLIGPLTVSWGCDFPEIHVKQSSNKPQELKYVRWFFQMFASLWNNNMFLMINRKQNKNQIKLWNIHDVFLIVVLETCWGVRSFPFWSLA